MIDIQFIRDNKELVRQKSSQKGIDIDVDQLLGFDKERLELLKSVEALRQKRNMLASSAKGSRPSDTDIAEGKVVKEQLTAIEHKLTAIEQELNILLKAVPNMPTDDTPVGSSEEENVVEYEWGEKPIFDFQPKNHWSIGEARGWIDKERAAKIAGARFAYLKGDLALMSNALMRFGIDTLTDQGVLQEIINQAGLNVSAKPFIFVLPPLMIREEVYDAMDRLEPREERYQIAGTDLWLQGSAEHVLGSMHYNEVLPSADLPIRYVGYATSFRQEAGSYGKDMEGIVRLHQFDKLEMETLSHPDKSYDEHIFLVAIQEYLMKKLNLPYRKLLKCTYDIGKPNARGVDIDAWLAGQGKYRETHTADYMTDYQARRLRTRFKSETGEQRLVHTNDATAFSQRPLIAIIENNQTVDGSVRIPEILRQYMGGKEYI